MKTMKLEYRRLGQAGHMYMPEGMPDSFAPSVVLNRTFVREYLQGIDPKDTELVVVVGRRGEQGEPPS